MKKILFSAATLLLLVGASSPSMNATDSTVATQTQSSSSKTSYNPFEWLSYRYVTASDLYGCSSWDLRIMRNAIYAMHGRKFKSSDLREYFSQFTWYHPRYNEVRLSKIEQYNVNFIASYE